MSRNLKLVITSILSVVILIALTGFFALAFVGILIIYFILRFYKKVKPLGNGWSKVTNSSNGSILPSLLNVFLGLITIQGFLFGTGKILLQETYTGILMLFAGITAMILLVRRININESV